MRNKAFDHSKYQHWIDPNKVIPYERNAKIHDGKQVENICTSIRRFGWQQDTVLTSDNVLVIGHGRRLAALKLGCEMPYHVIDKTADELTDEDIRELRIADNQTNAETGLDFDMLNIEIKDLDFDGFEFDFGGLDGCSNGEEFTVVEDEVPETPAESKSKRGDIWQLGRHRLMCGDSTSKEMVSALFEGVQPFCIVTDPPYCSGGFQEAGKKSGSIGTRSDLMIANDTLSTRGYMALIKSVIEAAGSIGIAYLFTDWRMWVNLFDCMESSGFGVRNMIVWDKGTPGMGVGWRSQHELCMMASRSAQKFNPHKAQGNVIKCQRTGNINHPTEKPVELMAKIIDVTDFADDIYDPFSGSGTTLIACEQIGKTCYAMELDPHYCDVVIKRWEDFTGQKAVLLNG